MRFTMIPNEVIDVYLRELKPGELKVLLVVLRQTLGYSQGKGSKRRKIQDWISISQFKEKTGCDGKTISLAIQSLIDLGIVSVSDGQGNKLASAQKRRGKRRLYFRQTLRTGDIRWITRGYEGDN
ncbi:MAG: replication protein [Bacteroidota bacterium]